MLVANRVTSLAAALLTFFAQAAAGQEQDRTRVAILMFDGVQIIDFAGPYEVFGQARFEVYTVSTDGESVTTAMKLEVDVDHDFASAPPADVLLIPGGSVRAAASDPRTLEFIREHAARADHVLSVCTGSFVLAATGLLDGKEATTFHHSFDEMARQFPRVEVVRDRRWVDSGKLVTSAGLSSGIDAALHVVAEIAGVDSARTVASHLEYEWEPGEREGYIRGLLADQHMRFPAGLFPEDMHVMPMVSFGDKLSWHSSFHVSSPLDPNAFIARLRELATAEDGLEVTPGAKPDSVAWRYVDAAGEWQLTVTAADAAGDNGLELAANLSALD